MKENIVWSNLKQFDKYLNEDTPKELQKNSEKWRKLR